MRECDQIEQISPLHVIDVNKVKSSSLSSSPLSIKIIAVDDLFADYVHDSSSFVASDVPAADSKLPSTTTRTTVPTETANTPRGICPCCNRSDMCINKTLNYAGIALAVCIERSFSYFLSSLDWSVRTVRICSTCNSKAVAALRMARTNHSSISEFAPPPKGRKQAAIQFDREFITSHPSSITLVSFTFELQRKHSCITSFPIKPLGESLQRLLKQQRHS